MGGTDTWLDEYSRAIGVDPARALEVMQLEEAASALQAMILEANPAWYAGLWVESKAGFEVLVYSTDPDAPGLSTMTASVDGLDGRVRAIAVEVSLRQLVAEQQLIVDAWRGEALPFTLDIDVRVNRVEVGQRAPCGPTKTASQCCLPTRDCPGCTKS